MQICRKGDNESCSSSTAATETAHNFWDNLHDHGGGEFFHSKGTWGCAAREGILFRTSSLAKGVLFGNFSRVKSRQGYAFWEFWSKRCQNSVIFVKKTQLFLNFGPESAEIWQALPRK